MAREALADLKARFSGLWSQTWPIMAATEATIVVVLLVGDFAAPAQSDAPLLRLVLLSIGGAVIYCALLNAIGSPAIGDGVDVAGWILRRHRA